MIFSVMEIISESRVFRAATQKIREKQCLTLDWDNQLGDDWKNLGTSVFKHVEHTLHSNESIGVLLLPNALKEDGQVMMVVQLLGRGHLPPDDVLGSVLNHDWQVSPVVESSELSIRDGSSLESTGLGLLGLGLLLRSQ
jgi:hypothetical protein